MSNNEILKRSGMTGIECMITKQQLQRVGHVTRINDRMLQKQVLHGQLLNAKRRTNGQKLRYKDMLGHQLQMWASIRTIRFINYSINVHSK